MPTISVSSTALWQELGREYTTQEFDELCFEFGIELDGFEDGELKIEVPANRYDLLCFEGISSALKVFLGKQSIPQLSLSPPKDGQLQTLTISPSTAQIRPLCSAVILRGIHFTPAIYDSFIGLQDKLHQNLARQRTLVSIGTHDLDTIKGPFSYEALKPEDISFVPLSQTKEMNGKQLMEFYEKDKHLGRYLHIIRDSPVYPVIYDANRTVLSLPPIINGNHSKITLNTKNVLVEITALDRTKVEIVNHILTAAFAGYCSSIEGVQIISDFNNESRITPDLTPSVRAAEVSYLNSVTGLSLSPEEIGKRLERMGYTTSPSKDDSDLLDVTVPITRPDVLHQADIMEDLAIASGYSNLPQIYPGKGGSQGCPLPHNKLSDLVRVEAAAAGWIETMPLTLCSFDENFTWLNRTDSGIAIKLANPKTAEYQIVRTSLLPGLLKTLNSNRHHALPIKTFEAGDVAFQDASEERKTRNERHFAAAWMGKSSGFEQVHGLLDRLFAMLKLAIITKEEGLSLKSNEDKKEVDAYWIEESEDPTFLPGHAANIFIKIGGRKAHIGQFGILHPSVLRAFELSYPVSTLEFNLEVFL